MKRVVVLALAAVTVFAFAACTSAPKAEEKPAAVASVAVPEGRIEMLDDFEEGLFWELDTTAPDGLDIDLTSDNGVVSGDNALLFMFKETDWAVVSTRQPALTDWTDARYLAFDVYNDGSEAVEMGICLMDGDNWEWQQSPSILIEPGKQTFVAGLTDGTFLTSAGGLHAIPAPNGAENIAFLAIVVHKSSETTTVYIDDVRLIY